MKRKATARLGKFRRRVRTFWQAMPHRGEDLRAYQLLVKSLFSSPASILQGAVAGVLTPFVCWLATDEPVFAYLTWALIGVVVLRSTMLVRYWRTSHDNDTLRQTLRWDREYFLGATAQSFLIGITSYIALAHTDSEAAHVASVACVIAFASGYVARNAARPIFVALQLVSFCLPLLIGLLSVDNVYYHYIGYFSILFFATNIAITFSIHRNLVALVDATRRSEALASALRQQNVTLDAALTNMSHGLAMFDRDLSLVMANQRFRELYELPEEALASGASLRTLEHQLVAGGHIAPEGMRALVHCCEQVLESGRDDICELETLAGKWLAVSIAKAAEGGAVMLTEDATERKATEAKIERMARFDDLTGLANRFEIGTVLSEACAALAKEGPPFAVLYIDLDNFKQVNDSLGHSGGDRLLIETTRRLTAELGPGDFVGRFGGDEFVMIKRLSSPEGDAALGQSIVETMTRPFEINGKMVYVTASVGIALAPLHAGNPSDLLREADMALYHAKSAGRSAAVMFSPAMAEAVSERHEIATSLRVATERSAFELAYQPIIDLETRRVISFEALLRWQHPTRGAIPPDVFIPIAEQTGLIGKIGEWTLRRACLDAANWPEDVTVSVNVSPLQFRQSGRLVETVREALQTAGLSPSRLSLEVTESLLIEDQDNTLSVIRDLRRLGVRFSLDDFGTGYSSLAYLSTYPFTQVKIDRSFARDVTSNANSRSIIHAVCQLARRLGMQTVVEGVETEEQAGAVKLLGAERGQGYLFGRPEKLERIESLLRRAA